MRLRQQTLNPTKLFKVVCESFASSEDAGMLSLGRVAREQGCNWRILPGSPHASLQRVLGVWGARDRVQTQPGSRTCCPSRSCRCWLCLWAQAVPAPVLSLQCRVLPGPSGADGGTGTRCSALSQGRQCWGLCASVPVPASGEDQSLFLAQMWLLSTVRKGSERDEVEPRPPSSFPPALWDAAKSFPILGGPCRCLGHSTRCWKGRGELLVLGCPWALLTTPRCCCRVVLWLSWG